MRKQVEVDSISEMLESYARTELIKFELPIDTFPDGMYSACKIKEWCENVINVMKAVGKSKNRNYQTEQTEIIANSSFHFGCNKRFFPPPFYF